MRQFITSLLIVCLLTQPVLACMWDYDTLAMERERFPDALELISGNFVRHSNVYYEWRIKDRTKKPVEDRTPMDYDDIAVAYDKLGQSDKAIETIQEKIARFPEEGRYESESNLATFLVHADQLEESLIHVKKALEINPNAHFGREIYQQLLVEYMLQGRNPETDESEPSSEPAKQPVYGGFAGYVMQRATNKSDLLGEHQKAVKGVLGMMRFARYDSPLLFRTLGELMASGERGDAKMIGARAYLKASYEVDDEKTSNAYRQIAINVLHMQMKRDITEIETSLKKEIAQGDEFFRQITEDETRWVAAGLNLDEEFARKYYQAPPLIVERVNYAPMSTDTRLMIALATLLVILIGLPVSAIVLYRLKRRRPVSGD